MGWALNAFDATLCSLVLAILGQGKTTAGGFSRQRQPDLWRGRQQVSQLSRIGPFASGGAFAVLLKIPATTLAVSLPVAALVGIVSAAVPLPSCLANQYRARIAARLVVSGPPYSKGSTITAWRSTASRAGNCTMTIADNTRTIPTV